eukprot:SAG11_NODE_1089_length_5920_cov_12.988146_4_plen_173_part_00
MGAEQPSRQVALCLGPRHWRRAAARAGPDGGYRRVAPDIGRVRRPRQRPTLAHARGGVGVLKGLGCLKKLGPPTTTASGVSPEGARRGRATASHSAGQQVLAQLVGGAGREGELGRRGVYWAWRCACVRGRAASFVSARRRRRRCRCRCRCCASSCSCSCSCFCSSPCSSSC